MWQYRQMDRDEVEQVLGPDNKPTGCLRKDVHWKGSLPQAAGGGFKDSVDGD